MKVLENTIQYLEWDSEAFGLKVGKVDADSDLELNSFSQVASAYDLVYIFSPKPLNEIPDLAQLVDIRVLFYKNLEAEGVYSRSQTLPSGLSLTSGINSNWEELQALAFLSGNCSRFQTDQRLPKRIFQKLYQEWLKKACSKGNLQVLKDAGKNIGLLTWEVQNKSWRVGLLAIDEAYQNKGLGSFLLQEFEDFAKNNGGERIYISTQEFNQNALQFYTACGYTVKEKTWVYHWVKGDLESS